MVSFSPSIVCLHRCIAIELYQPFSHILHTCCTHPDFSFPSTPRPVLISSIIQATDTNLQLIIGDPHSVLLIWFMVYRPLWICLLTYNLLFSHRKSLNRLYLSYRTRNTLDSLCSTISSVLVTLESLPNWGDKSSAEAIGPPRGKNCTCRQSIHSPKFSVGWGVE